MRRIRKLLGPTLAALLVLGSLLYSFIPVPIQVDVAIVERGSLLMTVDREGKTRVREPYVVSAPLAGRITRIELHPGDRVEQDQTVLAVIEPGDPSLLDPRARAEAEARVRAAEEASKLAEMNLQQARSEAERARRLGAARNISEEEFERALYRERAANFSLHIAQFEHQVALAALQSTQPLKPGETHAPHLEIRSPISGSVLEVLQESSRTIPVGTELLKIGDTSHLECVIDVLTTDAVKIPYGAPVFLEHWGGEQPLAGRVRLIEPAAFTKVSALGVEEQRVNVLVDFTEPRERWQMLGDGYRVEARILIWKGDDVVKAPAGAFFRQGETWSVYRVVDRRAQRTRVEPGRTNGLETQILSGLAEGDTIILHPSDRIADGVRVADGGSD
jgi:HlyD family secretion protein